MSKLLVHPIFLLCCVDLAMVEAREKDLHFVAMQSKHVKGLACFGCWSRPAGFTPCAFRCSISDALVLDLDENIRIPNTSKSSDICTDKIMYGLDNNLSVIFLF